MFRADIGEGYEVFVRKGEGNFLGQICRVVEICDGEVIVRSTSGEVATVPNEVVFAIIDGDEGILAHYPE